MRGTRARNRAIVIAVIAALAITIAPAAITTARGPAGGPATVDVQLLAVNDFHGNLQPPSGSSGRVGSINAGPAYDVVVTDTVPSRPTVIDCALAGMVMAGWTTKPDEVTSWPLASLWNEPSRV